MLPFRAHADDPARDRGLVPALLGASTLVLLMLPFRAHADDPARDPEDVPALVRAVVRPAGRPAGRPADRPTDRHVIPTPEMKTPLRESVKLLVIARCAYIGSGIPDVAKNEAA